MDILVTITILSAIVMSGFRRLKLMTLSFAAQSLSIAVLCFYLGYKTSEHHYYILGLLTIIIKTLIIPFIMNKSIKTLKTAREMNMIVNGFWSYIFSAIAVSLTYMFLKNFDQELIKTGVVLILIGAFILISRKKAINQMIGFLTVENGLVLIELSTVKMNLVIEVGMFLEVMILALVMGIMIFHINKTFDSINTDYLSNLKE